MKLGLNKPNPYAHYVHTPLAAHQKAIFAQNVGLKTKPLPRETNVARALSLSVTNYTPATALTKGRFTLLIRST